MMMMMMMMMLISSGGKMIQFRNSLERSFLSVHRRRRRLSVNFRAAGCPHWPPRFFHVRRTSRDWPMGGVDSAVDWLLAPSRRRHRSDAESKRGLHVTSTLCPNAVPRASLLSALRVDTESWKSKTCLFFSFEKLVKTTRKMAEKTRKSCYHRNARYKTNSYGNHFSVFSACQRVRTWFMR